MNNIMVKTTGVSDAPKTKVKIRKDGSDFSDMLSNALRPSEQKQGGEPDKVKQKESEPKTRPANDGQPEPKLRTKRANPETRDDETKADATTAAILVSAEALVQPVAVQEQTLTPETVNPASEMVMQIETAAQPAQGDESMARAGQETDAGRDASQNADFAAEPNAVNPEEAVAQKMRISIEKPEAGESQERFDEMLARASQELGQNKGIKEAIAEDTVTEAVQEPVEDDTVLEKEQDLQADEPAKTAGDVPQGNSKVLPKYEAQANPTGRAARIQDEEKKPAESGEAKPEQVYAAKPEVFETQEAPEAEASGKPYAAEQAEQIRTQVMENLKTGRMEFRMQLNPEELGRINVRMVLEGGKLAVEIIAANSSSAQLLAKQAESLAGSLKSDNIDVASVDVVTAGENASGAMDSQYNLNNFENQAGPQRQDDGSGRTAARRGVIAESEAQAADSDLAAPQRLLNYAI